MTCKPQGSGVTFASSPAHPFSPSRSRGTENSAFKPRGEQCFHCKGYGHVKVQCPHQVVGLSNKQDLEEVYILDQSMILEGKKIYEDEDSASNEDQPIYVPRPLLSTHAKKEED